jgi:glutamate synthase domain-containing protein 3
MDGIIIILESGAGIHIGDTQATFGHMITGGIIFLLGLFARLLDQKFNLDQECQDSENQEQE